MSKKVHIISHLIITIIVLVGYIVLRAMGITDQILNMAVMAVIGFWFGAVETNIAIGKKKDDNQ